MAKTGAAKMAANETQDGNDARAVESTGKFSIDQLMQGEEVHTSARAESPPRIAPPVESEDVQVFAPLLKLIPAEVYCSRNVYINRLSERQKNGLHRLRLALGQRGTTLENGKQVETPAEAVKWLLEQLEVA